MKTIAELKDDLAGSLHGTTLDSVWNIQSIIHRAIANVLSKVDAPETKTSERLLEGVSSGTTRYLAPKFLKGSKIIRVFKNRKDCFGKDCLYSSNLSKHSASFLSNNSVGVEHINGVKFLKISENSTTCDCEQCKKALLHSMDTFSCDYCTDRGCKVKEVDCNLPCPTKCSVYPVSNQNKTDCCDNSPDCENPPVWRVHGRVNNLHIDCVNHITGSGCVNVDLAINQEDGVLPLNGSVEIENLCKHDISDFLCGRLVLNINIPQPEHLTGIKLHFGQSRLDKHTQTLSSFRKGYQSLYFNLQNLQTEGMPNIGDISWYEIEFITDGVGQSGIKIDSLFLDKPCSYEIEYYANSFVRDGNGNLKDKYTEETDVIYAEADTYELIHDEAMVMLAQQLDRKSVV
jgi:hypothetical protein